jgi:hypothetical protein
MVSITFVVGIVGVKLFSTLKGALDVVELVNESRAVISFLDEFINLKVSPSGTKKFAYPS